MDGSADDSHPSRDSDDWINPDLCVFCGENLSDGGAGFIAHIQTAETCAARFEEWLANISGDMEVLARVESGLSWIHPENVGWSCSSKNTK